MRAVPLILVLALLPFVALADDDLAGFSGTRAITATSADSPCIGKPMTPLCAAETLMACSIRRDVKLCRVVGVEVIPSFIATSETYEFVSARYHTQADVDQHTARW